MRLPPDARLRADVGGLLEKLGETGDDEVLDSILVHLRLLARWNDAYNLTRITDWLEVLDRHVRESLLPLKWIVRDRPGSLLDVGSGNGYPAFPILSCRSRLQGVLLERSERKGLFLEAVIRECGWQERATVDATDAERYGPGTPRSVRPTGSPAIMSAADIAGRLTQGSGEGLEKSTEVRSAASSAADNRAKASEESSNARDEGGRSSASSPRGQARDENAPGRTRRSGTPPVEGPLFDYVITRATLPPHRFLELAARWVAPGGRVFLLAGENQESHDVSGRLEETPGLVTLARERISGRRASYLHVFERRA